MFFHDLDAKNVTEADFSHLLKTNSPAIIRNCDQAGVGLDTSKLRRVLCALELCCRNEEKEEEIPKDLTKLCENEIKIFQNYNKMNHNEKDDQDEIGKMKVSVQIGSATSDIECRQIPLADCFKGRRNKGMFQDLVKEKEKKKDQEEEDDDDDDGETNDVPLYLKDFHLQELFEKLSSSKEKLYELPFFMRKFATEDDLQLFQRDKFDHKKQEEEEEEEAAEQEQELPTKFGQGEEYRFVYAGGKSTGTSPHFDVCASYSFSINLSGQKLWIFPSSAEANEELLESDFLCPSTPKIEARRETVLLNSPNHIKIIQKKGDIIFVPALVIHQVENTSSCCCCSFNHNWYVAEYSIPHLLRLLAHEAKLAFSMISEETYRALRGKDEDQVGKKEWELCFARILQGSSAYCINVVRRFLEFCQRKAENEKNSQLVKRSLQQVEKLQREVA